MKWIGQHIYDLVSRFRDDVYLEDISTGTIASGAHLGLDSNNKIVKAADGGGDLTSIVAGTGLSGTSLTGPIPTLNVDAAQTGITSLGTLSSLTVGTTGKINFRDGNSFINSPDANDLEIAATDITLDSAGNIYLESDSVQLSSDQANDPLLLVTNTTDDASGARIKLFKNRGADGQDGDSCGLLQYTSFDDGTPSGQLYGQIETTIHDATAGQESGKMELGVANHDGSIGAGLVLTGGSAEGEIDVTVGLATASVTTVAGTLTMGSTATINNSGVVQVAAQTVIDHDQLANFAANEHFTQANITTVGTVGTGVWNGTAVASAYLDADTAHLSGSQTFTGTKTLNSFKGTGATTVTNILDEDAMGSDSATALATQQSIKAYADRPAKQIVLMRAAFKDDIGTTKHYIPLQSELEQTNSFHEMNSFVAPFAGKLLKLMYNGSANFAGGEFSFTLEQIPRNVGFATTPTVLDTITITGPTNNTTDPNMVIADFTSGSGTNAFTAGDMVMVGIQSDTDVTASISKHFFTLVFEFDFSGLA